MYISTITVAEYCVNGDISELPLRNVRIVPFNIQHAIIAGKFAKALYDARLTKELSIDNRLIIPNDAKSLHKPIAQMMLSFLSRQTQNHPN